MGRVKLKIKRIESANGRQTTYAKRKSGILKKANELEILCDIDILLLMFSPTGKPSLFVGQCGIEEVIAKFALLTPQERAKRQLEGLGALKKAFKKLDHNVNIQDFLGARTPTVEVLTDQMTKLRTKLKETEQRLSYWSDPSKIENLDCLELLKESLGKSLDAIRARKEEILRETTDQLQNEMQIPYRVSLEQHYQPLPWGSHCETPHMALTEDSSMISQRETDGSANSSFSTYSTYMDLCKRLQSDALRDDTEFLSELGRCSSLGQLFSGQYSFPSFGSDLLSTDTKYPTEINTNLQNSCNLVPQTTFSSPTDHASWTTTSNLFFDSTHTSLSSAYGHFFDTKHGVWGSTSGPSADTSTTNGSWTSSGPYPMSLFNECYQPQ